MFGGAGYFDRIQGKQAASPLQFDMKPDFRLGAAPTPFLGGLEIKPDFKIGGLVSPFIGGSGGSGGLKVDSLGVSSGGGIKGGDNGFGYAGLAVDLSPSASFTFTPSIAAGMYGPADQRDGSHPLELRSGVEATYQFTDSLRAGLSLYNINGAPSGDTSNSGSRTNSQVMTFTFSMPFGGGK
jgi:hypothetical protein